MYIPYEDILRRIPEPPLWWSSGVPRYDKFNPEDVDVYASCCALVHTQCCCGTEYFQAIVPRDSNVFRNGLMVGAAGMGDPPNACHIVGAGWCGSAATTWREIRVVEFWEKMSNDEWSGTGTMWRRQPEFEVQLTDLHEAEPGWEIVDLTSEQRSIVDTAFAQGGKIAAVKAVCELTGTGLSSAKFWVDNNFL